MPGNLLIEADQEPRQKTYIIQKMFFNNAEFNWENKECKSIRNLQVNYREVENRFEN